MGLSSSSLNLSTSNLFRAIPTPAPNRAEISRGAFITPSATPLSPSNTAYGTNANAILGGNYVSSAAMLEKNTINTTNNIFSTQNAIENGNEMEQALNLIAQQTPGSKFATTGGIFTTNKPVEPQTQLGENTRESSAVNTFSNFRTESNIFDSRVSLTGRSANVNAETAANFASVNANFNVRQSQQAASALQALQSAAFQGTVTARMDGMIPMAPSMPANSSTTTQSSTAHARAFDNLTETFSHIMGGGGQGGGGGLSYSGKRKDTPTEEVQQKKPFSTLG